MEVLFTYKKRDLFKSIRNHTLIASRAQNIPFLAMQENMYCYVKEKFCEAGKRVLKKIGGHTKGINIPYIVTKEGQNFPEADAINFTMVLHDEIQAGAQVPLIDVAIKEFLRDYVLYEWYRENGAQNTIDIEEKLQEIKRACEYGNKAKLRYSMY